MSIDPTQNINKKILAIPYDENNRPSYILILAITDIDGNITGYLPPAAIDNGNGTATIKIVSA